MFLSRCSWNVHFRLTFLRCALDILRLDRHMMSINRFTLRWRHSDQDGVSNHQPRDCLFNRLFRRRSKKTSKLRVTGLCAGNSPETGEFPAKMASYAENVSIWWRHHGTGSSNGLLFVLPKAMVWSELLSCSHFEPYKQTLWSKYNNFRSSKYTIKCCVLDIHAYFFIVHTQNL